MVVVVRMNGTEDRPCAKEAASKSNSAELRDAVNLRNKAFANRVGKLGINLEELKPEEKPNKTALIARMNKSSFRGGGAPAAAADPAPAAAAAKNAAAKDGGGGKAGGSGKSGGVGGDKKQRGKKAAAGAGAKGVGSASKQQQQQQQQQQESSNVTTNEEAAEEGAADAADAEAAAGGDEEGGGGGGDECGDGVGKLLGDDGEELGSDSPALIPAGKQGLARYKRDAKKQQTQRRLAVKMEMEREAEQHEEEEEEEESEKRQHDVQDLLKRDAEKRVLAERERIRKERMAEIEAKAMTKKADPDMLKKLQGMGVGGDVTDQRSKMEKLFSLITRSLGVPEDTDAMVVADTIADLAANQKRREREEVEQKRREADEAKEAAAAAVAAGEDGADAMERAAEEAEAAAVAAAEAGSRGVAGLASAQLTTSRADRETLLKERKQQLAAFKAEVQAKLTAKANEISGGGLASVKDVVDLEEKIEVTGSHTEWTISRCAVTAKAGKNACMGINEMYAMLRRKGRVWRAVDIFGKKSRGGDDDEGAVRSSSRLELAGPTSPNAVGVGIGAGAGNERSGRPSRPSISTIDDAWDVNTDPNGNVHPGPPLAQDEGDASADEGGMIDLNVSRIDDVAASLVAMARAARIDGAERGKKKSSKSVVKLAAVGEDGAGSAGEGGEGEGAAAAEGGDGAGAGDDVKEEADREKIDDDGAGAGGDNASVDGDGDGKKLSAGKRFRQKSIRLKAAAHTVRNLKTMGEFKGMKMTFVEDSSSSDDDDVQAGGRARAITAASDDDDDDNVIANPSGAGGGGGGAGGGGGRGKRGGRGMQGMMARSNARKSAEASNPVEVKPRQRKPKPSSSSSSPRSSDDTSSSSSSLQPSSSTAKSSMPKISESSPASGKTPTRGAIFNKGTGGGKTKAEMADGKVTSVTGGNKDLYSGKVKKKAGNPEYPTGFFDSQPHSGSRSFSADRPLPV